MKENLGSPEAEPAHSGIQQNNSYVRAGAASKLCHNMHIYSFLVRSAKLKNRSAAKKAVVSSRSELSSLVCLPRNRKEKGHHKMEERGA